MSLALKSVDPLVLVVDEGIASNIENFDAGTAYTAYLHEQVGDFDERPLGEYVEAISETVNPRAAGNSDRQFNYADLREIDEIYGQVLTFRHLPGKEIGSAKKRFRKGDILFARIMPSLANKKVALITDEVSEGLASTEFLVLRPKDDCSIDSHFLFRAIRADGFTRQAVANVTGATGRQRISVDRLLELRIVVPPEDLRQQIAKSVEEEFRLRSLANEESKRADELAVSVIGPTSPRTLRVSQRAQR
jgi:type I restriction enzyme S subunit